MAMQTRPPVVTIMGHVDHGKTTLLDFIRHTSVQAKEAGGITQHIGAYQVEHQGKKITFIDTPGHAAFNKMRQRGAQVTDIVVLVVAADDGVKPQTIESIRFIKQSNVSVIVAINKIDLKNVFPDVAKGQLVEHGIMVTELGGDVEAVPLSAKTGKGVNKLLETILVLAELNDLKADPAAPLKAVVIESAMDAKRGPVASVIVQQGTLTVRQDIETEDGMATGRVRALVDERGQQLKQVEPGSPAEIIGFKTVPEVGAIIHDVTANYVTEEADEEIESATTATTGGAYSDWDVESALAAEGKEKIRLIIRADVQGTLEAILQNLDEESIELINSGVGQVNESDVEQAYTSDARIIAFHIPVSGKVKQFAKQQGVKIKEYNIIYELIEDLQKQMLKLMDATINQVQTGDAEIVQIFEMKNQRIAGCRVITGEIKKTDKLRLRRGEEILANPVIASMYRAKEEIDRAAAKSEFGMTFKNKRLDFQVGDHLVAYYEQED